MIQKPIFPATVAWELTKYTLKTDFLILTPIGSKKG